MALKGLKQSSSEIQISTSATATTDPVAQQFQSKRVDLQLNPLDNEVFVVTGVKIDFTNPVCIPDTAAAGQKTLFQRCSLSTTEQTTYEGIASSAVIAASAIDSQVQQTGAAFDFYVVHENNAMDAPPASMDYLKIIATNDFFINLQVSTQYAAAQTVGAEVRLFGYRAKADASTYAALVQSEVLSS